MADSKPTERKISPRVDAKGGVEWRSQMTAPNDSVAVINMVSDRIIPIVFVPGVMGSNLQGIGEAEGIDWRLDTSASMGGWLNRDEDERKKAAHGFLGGRPFSGFHVDVSQVGVPRVRCATLGWGI